MILYYLEDLFLADAVVDFEVMSGQLLKKKHQLIFIEKNFFRLLNIKIMITYPPFAEVVLEL